VNKTELARAPIRERGYARARRWGVFVIMGGLNTAITVLLAWALMLIVDYRIAYVASFAVGIVIANYLYSAFVFRVPARAKNTLPLGAWYVASGLIGTVLVSLMTELFGIMPQASVVLAAALMTPVNYVASKTILSTKTSQA
jgi:putative flippase GtrA